nr:branched-chain amino acid ABC transporter permease [Frondihabitans sp. PAMC 28766]
MTRGSVFGFNIASNNDFWIYTIVVIAVVMGVLRRINLSSFGASLNAIRDDPVKAASIGLPVKGLRLAAFTLSGAVAGLAGALFAQQGGIVTPDTLSFTFSGQIIIMALLGGMYRFWGPAIGALIFQLLSTAVFGNSSNGTLYLGIILLVVVLVFPKGVLGLLERLTNRFPVLARLPRGRRR